MTHTDVKPFASLPLQAVNILGLPVHKVTMDSALSAIDSFIQEGTPHHIVTADASMMVMAREDAELHRIIAQADMVTPDSTGILWAARKFQNPLQERVSGVVIVEKLCALSPTKGYKLYFFGAAPGVAQLAAEQMQTKYPGAQIVGTHDGFFKPEENEAILQDIRACRPDILCVAFGIPKQEKWISANRETLGVPVLIGVGGTLDVLSGKTRRAPRLFQVARLEWLWRVLSNPRKISKVMLLPRFVRLVWNASRN